MILFTEGDDNKSFFIVTSGKVRVYANDEDGNQVILNYLSEGEYFGELALLDEQARSASVMTATACELKVLSKADFHRILLSDEDSVRVLLMELTGRIRQLTHNVKSLAMSDVYGRIRYVLLHLADEESVIANPKLTHQDIAQMVGSSREMVSKIMKELHIGGYIQTDTRHISIQKTLPKEW